MPIILLYINYSTRKIQHVHSLPQNIKTKTFRSEILSFFTHILILKIFSLKLKTNLRFSILLVWFSFFNKIILNIHIDFLIC